VQHYETGSAKIDSHRDKENPPDTPIAGLSLGEERILTMRRGATKVDIPLPHRYGGALLGAYYQERSTSRCPRGMWC
jgi:alkylated DNA repair dioxygenase AlkB